MLSLKHFFDSKNSINNMDVKPVINLKSAFDMIKDKSVNSNDKIYLQLNKQTSLKVNDKDGNNGSKLNKSKKNLRKIMNLKKK